MKKNQITQTEKEYNTCYKISILKDVLNSLSLSLKRETTDTILPEIVDILSKIKILTDELVPSTK